VARHGAWKVHLGARAHPPPGGPPPPSRFRRFWLVSGFDAVFRRRFAAEGGGGLAGYFASISGVWFTLYAPFDRGR